MSSPTIQRQRYVPGVVLSLFQSRMGRQFAALAGGTAATQAMAFLAAPFLTRLYSPEDFGHLAVFVAIYTMFTTCVSFKYEHAIPLAKDRGEAANLFVLALFVCCLQCCLVIAATVCLLPYVPESWLSGSTKRYFWLLAPALLFSTIHSGSLYWLIRENAFTAIARNKILLTLAKVGSELTFGFFAVRPLGLLLGLVIGLFIGAGGYLRAVWATRGNALGEVTWIRMKAVARRFANFPCFTTPSLMLSAICESLPVLLLPILFGPLYAGYFLIAQRLVMCPMGLIGNAISQVFYGEISRPANDPARVLKVFYKLSLRLFATGLASAVAFGSAPFWAGALLGGRWENAGWTIAAISPVIAFSLAVTPLSQAHHLKNTQSIFLFIEVVRFLLVLTGFFCSYWLSLPFLTSICVYSFVACAAYTVHWIAIQRILSKPDSEPAVA